MPKPRLRAARGVIAALAFAFVTASGAVTPASADDAAAVRARLTAVAGEAAANQHQIDDLQARIDAREQAIAAEREQIRSLAKAIYVEPESTLVVVAQSPDLADALSRVTGLLVAAARARAVKHNLDADLERLAAERTQLRAHLADLAAQQQQLENEYARLAALEQVAAPAQPAPPPPPSGSIPDLIRQAWSPLGPAMQAWAVRLAFCESTLNPLAVNRSSGAAGLFQFMPRTWAATPWRDSSPFDPSANAAAAAWLYQRYGAGQWDCSSRI